MKSTKQKSNRKGLKVIKEKLTKKKDVQSKENNTINTDIPLDTIPVKIGRPRKFESNEQLQEMIQSYFNSIFEYKRIVKSEPISIDKKGKVKYRRWIENVRVMVGTPSLSGLQAHIGIFSRTQWKDYKSGKYGDDFKHTLEGATKHMENITVNGGLNNSFNPAIVKFTLENNYGRETKVKNELSGNPFEGININVKKKK